MLPRARFQFSQTINGALPGGGAALKGGIIDVQVIFSRIDTSSFPRITYAVL